MAFRPFSIQFDKPTYTALKELAQAGGLNLTDTVTATVRLTYALAKNRSAYLTPEGDAKWRQIVDSFKKPAGLDI